MWEKNAVWPPPKLERLKPLFSFSEVIHNLPEDLKIKFTSLNDAEFLQVAYSITPKTQKAGSAPVFPFAFERTAITWSRSSSSPATNCVYLLRQLAAVNVVDKVWNEASREPFEGKVVFQKLLFIKRLLLLVKENGVIPPKLCPISLAPEFESLVDVLMCMLTIGHVTSWKSSQATCAKHIVALVKLWSTLDAITGPVLQKYRRNLRRAIKEQLRALIIYSAIQWQTIMGGTGADEASSALADAHKLATTQADVEKLGFLSGPVSQVTPTPFSDALGRDMPPNISGEATQVLPITATIEAVVGPLFTLY